MRTRRGAVTRNHIPGAERGPLAELPDGVVDEVDDVLATDLEHDGAAGPAGAFDAKMARAERQDVPLADDALGSVGGAVALDVGDDLQAVGRLGGGAAVVDAGGDVAGVVWGAALARRFPGLEGAVGAADGQVHEARRCDAHVEQGAAAAAGRGVDVDADLLAGLVERPDGADHQVLLGDVEPAERLQADGRRELVVVAARLAGPVVADHLARARARAGVAVGVDEVVLPPVDTDARLVGEGVCHVLAEGVAAAARARADDEGVRLRAAPQGGDGEAADGSERVAL
jgi:hypothetical protein